MLETLNRILPLPYPHFMGFAPLDTWWRLLTQDRAWRKISARYWVRIAGGLFTSCIGTAITLPERVLLWPLVRGAGGGEGRPAPPTVFVLGYYRSGTTHLHYLLSCDPKLATPRWYQMLAPQGFGLSWTFLRYFLVPFLSSTRPQDDVAYGSEYPAEDDFGVCNWACCGTMPGRMVVPGCWEHYARYHTLEGLTGRELERFRRTQMGLTWKLGALNRGRMLLLKTPAHTARVAELARMYGGAARFVHVHRDPMPVVKSNVAMHQRFAPFLLQPHPGDEEIQRRVIAEYDATERAFLAAAEELGPGRVARVRYEDLIADPIGELARAYEELGLEMTPEFARRAVGYLESVREYRAAGEKGGAAKREPGAECPPGLEWMREAFGHDRAAVAKREPVERARELGLMPAEVASTDSLARGERIGREEIGAGEKPLLNGWTGSLVAAFFCFAAWLWIAHFMRDRLDFLGWPVGVCIGLSALRGAGAVGKRGSTALGVWALALTLAVILGAAYPATWLAVRDRFSPVNLSHHVWLATRRGVLAWNNILWIGLGLTTAYRFASRQHVRPPGM